MAQHLSNTLLWNFLHLFNNCYLSAWTKSDFCFSFKAPTVIGKEEDTDYPEGPEPTPFGQCALPIPPRRDASVKPGDGIRFGSAPFSRQEFGKSKSFMGSIIDDSTFALEFKTSLQGSGVLFYVSDEHHRDFVALLMQNGKVNIMNNVLISLYPSC